MASSVALTLAAVRPVLLAFAVSPFMARDKHPELVQRCVFELWRAGARRARRNGDLGADVTDVSKGGGDAEARVPLPSESKPTAATFLICIEELGVTPPPVKGWVPQKKSSKDEPETRRSEGKADEKQNEWWQSPDSDEWIYNKTDGMYFHVPTSTLWERRELHLNEAPHLPEETRFTYFRSDAPHLQALSMFAASLDSALMPLIWAAWVRFARKHRKKREASMNGGSPKMSVKSVPLAPPTPLISPKTPGFGQPTQEAEGKQQEQEQQQQQQQQLQPEESQQQPLQHLPHPPETQKLEPSLQNDAEVFAPHAAVEGPVPEANKHGATAPSSADNPGELQAFTVSNGVEPRADPQPLAPTTSAPELPKCVTASSGDNSEGGKNVQAFAGSNGTGSVPAVPRRKRGWFFCFRGRSTSSNGDDRKLEYARDAPYSATSSGGSGHNLGLASKPSAKSVEQTDVEFNTMSTPYSPPALPRSSATSGRTSPRSLTPREETQVTVQRTGIEANDRHLRRLERLLEDVRKNPNRLISHIERRRLDRTHIAYIV